MGPDVLQGAYIARLDLAAPHLAGVSRKIEAQRAALARAGFPTRLHSINDGAVMCDSDVLRPAANGSIARRMTHYNYFWHDTLSAVADADFLYIRFQGAGPGLLKMLSKFRTQRPEVPILMEIPTYPYKDERRGVRQHLLGMVDDTCTPFLKLHVDRIVTFSSRAIIVGIPTIITRNGVEVSSLPLASLPEPAAPLRLVGVANFGIRHAYDRVIRGLANYRAATARSDVLFELIGSGELEQELRQLAVNSGVSDMVHFTGPLSGAALDSRLDGAHLGIAALGMHRISAETSDLKSREYCARGLPFVTANADGDFPSSMRHVHHISPDETPVDIAFLRTWCEAMASERAQVSSDLRVYADAHLSWDAKIVSVAAWLSEKLEKKMS
tara:strand:- start:6500 stop:7651 length:1152 start_codon:yes stop_codon:yes gene_type:complete